MTIESYVVTPDGLHVSTIPTLFEVFGRTVVSTAMGVRPGDEPFFLNPYSSHEEWLTREELVILAEHRLAREDKIDKILDRVERNNG
ncbi:hypothetical protein OAD26_00490 [bacterium]|nr:hypothetical protein [bacterium]